MISETMLWNLSWLFSWLLTSLGFALALLLLAHLLRQKRSPVSTLAWLLTIILLPYVGVPLYLMFGGRKFQRMAGHKERVYHVPSRPPTGALGGATERTLQSYGVPPASLGNVVRVVPDGESAYRELLALIDQAQATIHITTYILGRDEVGRAVVERLAQRAKEGIAIRLLLDAMGSWRVGSRLVAPLTSAGGRVAYFMRMFHIPFRGRANLRNHRKIVVIDGRRALVGGMNIAQEYMGPAPDPARWRDLSLVIEGPVVHELAELFRSDWKFATGEDIAAPEPPARVSSDSKSWAQVVASGPDVTGDPLYESLISVIFAARSRIWVVTPYFVPDETLARALELAARRGIDVRLVIPDRSNHLFADLARASYLHQVHDAGGKTLLFEPGMLHAKVMVVDDDFAVVGSANMDIRSLFLNYEVALFLYSHAENEALARWTENLIPACKTTLPVRGFWREMVENVVRLLSPLL
jgi:cardiolipin synthase